MPSDRNLEAPDCPATGFAEDALKVGRHFPTLVFSLDIPGSESLNDHLIKAIYAERERDATGVQRSTYRELGGWHSQIKLHKDPAFAGLVEQVDAVATMMCRELGYHGSYRLRIGTMWSIINPPGGANRAHIHPGCLWSGYHGSYRLRIGTMWSIINPPGGANRAHIHPGCLWSGVYYVQAPKNSGRIEFIDPRTQNLMGPAKYIPNRKRPRNCWTKVQYKPVAGRMLVFPAWLYHSVVPNRSKAKGKDADRVIVSFNLSQARRR